jgi:hypothetical protein
MPVAKHRRDGAKEGRWIHRKAMEKSRSSRNRSLVP